MEFDIKEFIEKLFYNRPKTSIKSDFGKALIIAGSKKYPGAAFIATKLCEFASPGYVALAVPETIYIPSVNMISPNSIHEIYSNSDDFTFTKEVENSINKYDSILFGNGINLSKENKIFLEKLLEFYTGYLVIDGTGLRLISEDTNILNKKNSKVEILLTPHLGEAKDLFKTNVSGRNLKPYLDLALDCTKKYQVNILLKSYDKALITRKCKIYNSEYLEIPSLAKAGSGDALAGLITGFLAYATKDFIYDDVIMASEALFSQAGKLIEEKYYAAGLTLDRLIEALNNIILKYKE